MGLRLFFGIPLPHRQAEIIAAWRDSLTLRGRPVAASNLHLTLAFLGDQPADRLAELSEIASRIEASQFSLTLDRLTISHHGLLALGPASPPSALLDLESQLREGLLACGYPLDTREFWPHVTLARRCLVRPGLSAPSYACQIKRFALYQSINDGRGMAYIPLLHWLLGRREED